MSYNHYKYRILSSDQERKNEETDKNVVDYETSLSSTGFGAFSLRLLFLSGLINASDAIEVIALSFLLPSLDCIIGLDSGEKGLLSALLFVGMMIGGVLWGSFADSIGRKPTLISSLLVNALAGIASAFSPEKISFFVLRFISGVGVGGSIPIIWSYFGEFLEKTHRGAMLSILASFWMIGNLIVAGFAWSILPLQNQFLSSWKLFTIVAALPSLIASFLLFFFPESPKFLISKGRIDEALAILSYMYQKNTGNSRDSYPYSGVKDPLLHEVSSNSSSNSSGLASLQKYIVNLSSLFSRHLFKSTLILLFINFAIQFGYYGLWLWFPQLFTKLNTYYSQYPNASVSVCDITSFNYSVLNSSDVTNCESEKSISSDVFMDSFLVSISALPGNIWSIVHMDKLGRKFFLVLSMLLSGIATFFIYFVTSSTSNLIISCAFGAVSTMGFTALDCLSIELFPTHLRSTAIAVTLIFARLGAILGNIIFGYFLDVNCAIPLITVSALFILGGLSSLALPNTTKIPIA